MTQQVAVVTGASSGIGEALAAAMAKRGTHVVLVARSGDKLEALATRVRQAGGQATVIVADLSQPGAAQRVFDDVQRRKLLVDTLVNNAGFGHFGRFEDHGLSSLGEMLQVNVVALAELTRLFIPSLLEANGTVLNLASTVAFQATPFMSAYGASKAFVLSFSEALWAEYRDRGLHVAAVCPGPVETPFIDAMGSGVRQTTIFKNTLTVDEVVTKCLSAMDGTRPSSVVGLANFLLAQSGRFAPRSVTARLSALMLAPKDLAVAALPTGGRS